MRRRGILVGIIAPKTECWGPTSAGRIDHYNYRIGLSPREALNCYYASFLVEEVLISLFFLLLQVKLEWFVSKPTRRLASPRDVHSGNISGSYPLTRIPTPRIFRVWIFRGRVQSGILLGPIQLRVRYIIKLVFFLPQPAVTYHRLTLSPFFWRPFLF